MASSGLHLVARFALRSALSLEDSQMAVVPTGKETEVSSGWQPKHPRGHLPGMIFKVLSHLLTGWWPEGTADFTSWSSVSLPLVTSYHIYLKPSKRAQVLYRATED